MLIQTWRNTLVITLRCLSVLCCNKKINMRSLSKSRKKILILSVLISAAGVAGGIAQRSESASLTNVSFTLSNPRPSFAGVLEAGNAESASQVIIDTTGHPSFTTDQLQTDDTVAIGNSNTISQYNVSGIVSSSAFNISPVLGGGDADTGDVVISTQSAAVTVRFTTANAIANGRFRILIPSLASNTDAADGLPDKGEFDFGASAPIVTCPTDLSGYDFVAGTASASAVTINGQDYHSYECAYSGSGAIGTAFNNIANNAISISNIINPAPDTGHTTGTADSHQVIVQHINSSFAVTDVTTAAVGVIEAVRITATVAPQISFSIAGVNSGVSTCGITTGVTTTAAIVPFGDLSISAFTHAAQTLTVSTNATNGYTVTAIENDQLGLNGGTCTGDNTGSNCIRDAAGDTALMSHTTSDEWTNVATKGFGYTIHNADAATVPFQYNTAIGNCTGTYCARQFADAENSQVAQSLFSSTTVADTQNVNVCYKAIIPSTQAAGSYENYVTYTATATF